jgi:hypothetical protein
MDRAARLAVESRHKGFHPSESVFLAINCTLHITDPAMVRAVTALHGGGDAHRKQPHVDLGAALEEVAAGCHFPTL